MILLSNFVFTVEKVLQTQKKTWTSLIENVENPVLFTDATLKISSNQFLPSNFLHHIHLHLSFQQMSHANHSVQFATLNKN